METDEIYFALENHFRNFFDGHEVSEFVWHLGPIQQTFPRFRVLRFSPGPRSILWVYISLGVWETREESNIEFMIIAPEESPRHVELLAMTAYYHSNHQLGLGHTLPIGEPWLEGSHCDCLLVSLPYTFGPKLEICKVDGGHVHLFWLLPITQAEREFKVKKLGRRRWKRSSRSRALNIGGLTVNPSCDENQKLRLLFNPDG
jgi:hypothetical protein